MLDMELTQENIKAILLDMFIGGTDTTSTTTEWLMTELLKHPNVMKRSKKRLHPAVPLLVPRETSASVKLEGYDIPSDITVFINAWAIQRDPNWWEKPEEFIPERFENSSFFPFGIGRIGCPGMPFGVASIEYVISNLLHLFDWKFATGEIAESLDMGGLYGLTVNKKLPLHVLPISHLST
ncbi:hypothetical protein CRYUN_Cryun12cG0166500 [Craigia yunnanensis]